MMLMSLRPFLFTKKSEKMVFCVSELKFESAGGMPRAAVALPLYI